MEPARGLAVRVSVRSPAAALLRPVFAAWLCCGAALAAGSEEAGKGAGESCLRIEEPEFDWGKAYQGEQIEHAFFVVNQGSGPLVIEEIKTSCGCTMARESERTRTLAPGERSSITLVLDTSSLRGRVRKETELVTAPRSLESKLWMQGDVEELLKFEPQPKLEVVLESLVPAAPVPFQLTPSLGKEAKVLSVKPEKGLVSAELQERAPGREYVLKLLPALKKENTAAFQTEVLDFKALVSGKELALKVQVPIVLKERIDVSPSRSVYVHRKETEGLGKPGSPKITKVLEIRSLGGPGHTFKITGVTSRSQVFEGTIEKIEEGKIYRLSVTLQKTPGQGERFLKDTLEVTTDDPCVPRIVIPAMAQF